MSLRDTRRTAAAAELGRRHPVWTLYGGPIVVGVVLAGAVVLAVRSGLGGLVGGLTGALTGGWLVIGLVGVVLVGLVGAWLFKRYLDGY